MLMKKLKKQEKQITLFEEKKCVVCGMMNSGILQ